MLTCHEVGPASTTLSVHLFAKFCYVFCVNEKGRKVEADLALCPLLSLFRREEHGDGDTFKVPFALQNY